MKALAARIHRLEARLAPQADLESWRAAIVLYERRCRRAEAEGERFDRPPPEPPVPGARYESAAETLRRKMQAGRFARQPVGHRVHVGFGTPSPKPKNASSPRLAT